MCVHMYVHNMCTSVLHVLQLMRILQLVFPLLASTVCVCPAHVHVCVHMHACRMISLKVTMSLAEEQQKILSLAGS